MFGQPRFIEDSIKSIKEEFNIPGYTTDYFFHFWDKVAYKSTDPENDIDQEKIINLVKPVKHGFTDYTDLTETSQEVFDAVIRSKVLLQDQALTLPQNIFSVNDPIHLKYYLGQFVSSQKVCKILKQYVEENGIEYDLVIRVRTDLFFASKAWYNTLRSPTECIRNSVEDNTQNADVDIYQFDKYLTYIKPIERYKDGIFTNKGDVGIWEKVKVLQDDMIDSTKISFTGRDKHACSCIEFDNNEVIFGTRRDGRKDICIFDKDYAYNYIDFHIKDWLIWGTQKAMLNTHKKLIDAVKYHIKRSAHRLNLHSRDNNWGSGELITGIAAFLSKTNIYDIPLCIGRVNALQNRRFFKIINKHSKENMLELSQITVEHNNHNNMLRDCICKYREQNRIDKGNEHK